MKNYKRFLKEFENVSFTNYHKKSYFLNCTDTNKNQNGILLNVYYAHCNYYIEITSIYKTKRIEGSVVYCFPHDNPIKLTMLRTTYKYSNVEFQNTIDFLMLNLDNLIDLYLKSNNNIKIDEV